MQFNGGEKAFLSWTKIKVSVHNKKRQVFFRKKEMWWAALGINIGYEQDGKNENFERPILVLQKINRHLLWAVPLSTQLKDHSYYHLYQYKGKTYAVIWIQLRVISSKRLMRKIGIFPTADFEDVKHKIKDML